MNQTDLPEREAFPINRVNPLRLGDKCERVLGSSAESLLYKEFMSVSVRICPGKLHGIFLQFTFLHLLVLMMTVDYIGLGR